MFDPEIGTSKIEGNITRKVPRQKLLDCRETRFKGSQKVNENFLLEDKVPFHRSDRKPMF